MADTIITKMEQATAFSICFLLWVSIFHAGYRLIIISVDYAAVYRIHKHQILFHRNNMAFIPLLYRSMAFPYGYVIII